MDFVYNAISVGVLVGICLCIVFLIGLVAHLVASEGILEKTTKIRDATGTFYVNLSKLRHGAITIKKVADKWRFVLTFDSDRWNTAKDVTFEYDTLEDAEKTVEKLVKSKML